MKKRVIASLLIFVLAVTALSALETFPLKGHSTNTGIKTSSDGKKSIFQFGLQVGYGFDNTNISISQGSNKGSIKIKEGGFYLGLTGEFLLRNNFVFKTELGFMGMGKRLTVTQSNNDPKTTDRAEYETPPNYNIYFGGEYDFVFQSFKLGIGAGLDIMTGKQKEANSSYSSYSDDYSESYTQSYSEKPNGRIGLGFEIIAKGAVSPKFTITAGLKGAFYFINTGDKRYSYVPALFETVRLIAQEIGGTTKHSQFGMKFFLGCIFTK